MLGERAERPFDDGGGTPLGGLQHGPRGRQQLAHRGGADASDGCQHHARRGRELGEGRYEHAAQDAAHLERVDAESQSAEDGEPQDVADAFNSRPALTWYCLWPKLALTLPV